MLEPASGQSSTSPTARNPIRTPLNTQFVGQKVLLHIHPELVSRGLLADLGTHAGRSRNELSRNPGLYRKERFLKPTLHTEDSLHCPCETIATTDTDRFSEFEVSGREASCSCDQLEVLVTAFLPFKVACFVAA